jgi:hypothetical protein
VIQGELRARASAHCANLPYSRIRRPILYAIEAIEVRRIELSRQALCSRVLTPRLVLVKKKNYSRPVTFLRAGALEIS